MKKPSEMTREELLRYVEHLKSMIRTLQIANKRLSESK